MAALGWTVERRIARIDDDLAKVATALGEARANNEAANIAICEVRYDELLDERNRIVPQPRPPT